MRGPYTAEYLAKVDYNMWMGPAPVKPFNRNRFHYNWHWQWDYGNGDTGNQGPHQFDIARWGLGKQEHPVKISSMGGYFGEQPTAQETPDMQTAMFEYADGMILEFGTRGEHTPDEGGVRIGNLFFGSKGWLWIDETGRNWQSYAGAVGEKNEKGPGSGTKDANAEPVGLVTEEGGHYGNFINAIRANDPKVLTCDILEGHLSSTLPHLANISYRVGHQIEFDGKTETIKGNDKKANELLTREYRKGFEIPKSFPTKETSQQASKGSATPAGRSHTAARALRRRGAPRPRLLLYGAVRVSFQSDLLSSISSALSSQLVMLITSAPISADKKPLMVKPGTNHAASARHIAFTTKMNRPRVTRVTGSVSTISSGRMIAFTRPRTMPAASAVPGLATLIPGISCAARKTATPFRSSRRRKRTSAHRSFQFDPVLAQLLRPVERRVGAHQGVLEGELQ